MKVIKKIAFLGLFLVSLSLTAQSAKLQYNLKKGDKYLIELKMKQNMAPILNIDVGVSMSMETIGNSEGNIDSKYQVKSMKLDMDSQGNNVSFDSTKGDENLSEEEKKMKAEIQPVLDMILYQTIDKSGKILSQRAEPEVKGIGAMLKQNQFVSMEYPSETLKVGSSWDFSQNMSGVSVDMKYTVTRITYNKVFADVTATTEGNADAKISGKISIDRKSGMISTMNLDLSMNAMGMTMSMDVTLNSKKI